MITRDSLPKSYSPYGTLVVCSNTLTGGGNIVSVREVLPVLVGKGEKPQVWLQALSSPDKNDFVTIVEASISKHPAVKVLEENGSLKIFVTDTNVLSVRVTGEDSAEVFSLDLRPLGLNLYGNQSGLQVGNSTFSRNTFSGKGTLIGFGE